jgi:hypothetical protein
MFVRIRRGESVQNFSVWVYGEGDLTRGSGLFVGDAGVATNHHFLLPADGTQFEFLPGRYSLEIYASLVGRRSTIRLFTAGLELSSELSAKLRLPETGVYFDWGADSNSYHAHARKHPKVDLPSFLREIAG